jgi:hypothetical protein
LIDRPAFLRRLFRHGAFAGALLLLSLVGGMLGFAGLEHMEMVDAFLDAAMLLGGMGPVSHPATRGGKIFAGLYALYAGLLFLVVATIMIAPVAHRLLHHFHCEGKD